MSVTVTFNCGGCDAKAEGTRPLRRTWHLVQKVHNGEIGRWELADPQEVAPEGWMAYDPYTQCTYCPACWASIEQGTEAAQ